MGNRLGQLIGIVGLFMVLTRLGRLFQTGHDIPRWHLILGASAFLGAVVWWLLGQLLASRRAALTVFAIAGFILFLRISVPDTLAAGILPQWETLDLLGIEMDQSIRLIRSGVPPIVPTEGVIAIVAVVMWVLGALYTWGASGGPVAAMVVSPLVVYLQFAVFDRSPAGLGWMTASTLLVGGAIASLALERRQESGRARDAKGRPISRRPVLTSLIMAGLVGLVAITTANGAAGLVSEYGNLPWRTGGSGLGPGSGGIAFDRFVNLRQSLISRTNAVLFRATVDGGPSPDEIYWRMETLDQYDGTLWRRSNSSIRFYEPGRPMGAPDNRYQGTTAPILHRVQIDQLRSELAPTAGVAEEIHPLGDEAGGLDPRNFSVATRDSSVLYKAELRANDQYQVLSTYSLQSDDFGSLATAEDGELSPMFARAAEEGQFNFTPSVVTRDTIEPPDLEAYTDLPEDTPAAIRGIALINTEGATTDFERAWALQYWFRDSGDFTYSTEVSTGHEALQLEAWLSDEDSINYKTGYCEQFAAAMAVLGRALGIPSRVVWGFTPGTVIEREDGTQVIEVRDVNAHAWVEMWMDGFGWVTFDPTPRGEFQPPSFTASVNPSDFIPEQEARPLLRNPVAPDPAGLGDGRLEDPLTPIAGDETARLWLLAIPGIALLLSLIPLVKSVRRRSRLRRIRQGDITAAWDEIVDRLTDLGQPVLPSKTPMELARDTDRSLLPLAVDYSAAVYGGRQVTKGVSDLMQAESWMSTSFDGAHRLRAALSPRSLFKRV